MKKSFIKLVVLVFVLFTCISCNLGNVAKLCEVTYVTQFGEAPSSIKVPEGTVLSGTQLPELITENYNFNGWYAGEYKDSSSIIENGTFTVTEDVTLTAKWTGVKCVVTYNPVEGSDEDRITEYYNFGQTFEIMENPYTVSSGKVFKGWSCNEEMYQPGDEIQASGTNMDFTAVIQDTNDNPYSIVYKNINETDKTVGGKNPTVFNDGDKVFIYDIYRVGYVFEGWYTDEAFTNKAVTMWQPTQAPLSSGSTTITLYAKITPIKYTVVFNSNGGHGKMATLECEYDKTYSLPSIAFEMTDSIFTKWGTTSTKEDSTVYYLDEAKIKNITTENNKVVNLYAYWKDLKNPDSPTLCKVYKREGDALTLSFKTPKDYDYEQTKIYVYKGTSPADSNFVKTCVVPKILCDRDSEIDFKIDELEPYTDYAFKLVSVDVSENESDPEILTGKTRVKQAQPVKNLKQVITKNSVTYTWEYPTDSECPEFSKLVISKKDENGKYQEIKTFSDKSKKEHKFDLQEASLYDYQFVIQETPDESKYTRPAAIKKTFCTPTADMTVLYAKMNTADSITLCLEVPAGNFDNIIIEYSNGGSNEKVILPSSTTEYKLTNLTSTAPYQIKAYTEKRFENESYVARSSTDLTYVSATETYEKQTGFAYIGSIFYNDGTYSINKNAAKTAIGIVASVNESYKPVYVLNKDEAECSCFSNLTDIWVQDKKINTEDICVPLTPNNCTTASNWEEVLKSLKNVMLPDTKVNVKAWNRGGVGTKVGEYTWFLPLRSEWQTVFKSHKTYDAILEYIGGAVVDDNKHYWTCEIEGTNAYYVDGNGTTGSFRRAEKTYDDCPSLPGYSRALLKVN